MSLEQKSGETDREAKQDEIPASSNQGSALSRHAVSLSKSPLGIITLFVLLIEVMATVSIGILQGTSYVGHMVWFLMLFPTFILILFFIVLWYKSRVLYGPSDFDSSSDFIEFQKTVNVKMNTMISSQERLDLKQKALQIQLVDPEDGAPSDEIGVIPEQLELVKGLVQKGEIFTAVTLGRSFLTKNKYQQSYLIFDYLVKNVDAQNPHYTRILANRAYSYIGLGRLEHPESPSGADEQFQLAIEDLEQILQTCPMNKFYVWHSMALAYANFRLERMDEYEKWLEYSKQRREYAGQLKIMREIYPEIAAELTEPPE